MNIKKKMIAFAAAAAILGGFIPYSDGVSNDFCIGASAETTVLAEDQLGYEIIGNEYVRINGISTYIGGAVEFPAEIEGLPVKEIGNGSGCVFYYDYHNNIGEITSITLPKTVITINDGAFKGCVGLETVEIPNSLTKIGNYAFAGCTKLSSCEIPETGEAMTVGNAAFAKCTNMLSVNIPDRVTDMGGGCFAGCSNLKYVTLSNAMTKLYDEKSSVSYSDLGAQFGFFEKCTSLENIVFPDSVASVDERVLNGCTSLSKINIGADLKELGNIKFDLDSLKEINVSEDNASYSSEDGVLMNKDKTSIIRYPKAKDDTEYNIPENVTSIAGGAFSDCQNLLNVTVPDGVTKIASGTFKNCTRLKKIVINNAECNIYNSPETIYKDAVIWGHTDSTAQEYADRYSYAFVSLDEPVIEPTEPTEPEPAETTTTTDESATTTTTTTTTETSTEETTATTTVTSDILIPDITEPTEPIETSVLGDANDDGKLNVRDAAFIAQLLAKGMGEQLPSKADFNGDGKINVRDAAAIAKFLATGKK